MKKRFRVSILIALLVVLSVFTYVNANKSNGYAWVADEVGVIQTELFENDNVAATVNGVAIAEQEVLRRVANVEILNKLEELESKKRLAAGLISQNDYELLIERQKKQKENVNLYEKFLDELIEEEIFYQEAVKRGFLVSDEDANTYYDKVFAILPSEQVEVLRQYAKGFGLTMQTYKENYILPQYIVKLTIGNMFADLLKELDSSKLNETGSYNIQNPAEYEQFVELLIKEAVVTRGN